MHFGYDSKDVAPSTYQISLSMPIVSATFQSDAGSPIAVAQCTDLRWNMQKGSDRISRQTVTCDINLIHHRTDKDVETLLSFNKSSRPQGEPAPPELKYTSTSKPSGDNVKTLEIVDSRFFMVYPGWKRLMEFFSELPEAEIMTPEQINLAIQVGDRWYKIGSSSHAEYEDKDVTTSSASRPLSWISPFVHGAPATRMDAVEPVTPNFQMRVLLTSPSIILSSADDADPASVVLRLDHLDFLHDKNGKVGNTTKSFFLDGLELYTSLHDNGTRDSNTGENSLIHPWCVSGAAESGVRHDCDQKSFRISADVLRARAAFSDMMVALQVCLRFVADFRQSRIQDKPESIQAAAESTLEAASKPKEETEAIASNTPPTKNAVALNWGGFQLLVVDDSGRHFAGSQELITLVLGRMLFSRQDCALGPGQASGKCAENSDCGSFSQQMTLYLQSVDLLDCLQPESSPFRLLLTSRCDGPARNDDATASNGRMSWNFHAMQESEKWGFVASPALLERMNSFYNVPPDDCNAITFTSFDDGGRARSYVTKIPSCSIQYNPSTVIALQRFLGRFKKQAMQSLHDFNEELDELMKGSHGPEDDKQKAAPPLEAAEVKADIHLQTVTLTLNKEHQNRRLLKVEVSGFCATSRSNQSGLAVEGSVEDISAWDCSNTNQQLVAAAEPSNPNACMLRVRGHEAKSFLRFWFHTFNRDHNNITGRELPAWMARYLGGQDKRIDDYLEVSLGTIELIYLRERTEEILDYLSNGLPGKGMGATSRAAQGFIKKRIRTKSFLHISIQSPTVFVPRDDFATKGLRFRLGKSCCWSCFTY